MPGKISTPVPLRNSSIGTRYQLTIRAIERTEDEPDRTSGGDAADEPIGTSTEWTSTRMVNTTVSIDGLPAKGIRTLLLGWGGGLLSP